MPLNWPSAGPNAVDCYRMSAVPFVSGVESLKKGGFFEISLPYVSKFLTFRNNTANSELAFGFSLSGTVSSSANGLGNNHFIVAGEDTQTFEIRTRQLFVSNSIGEAGIRFNFLAGLTTIPRNSFFDYTGSIKLDGAISSSFKGIG